MFAFAVVESFVLDEMSKHLDTNVIIKLVHNHPKALSPPNKKTKI